MGRVNIPAFPSLYPFSFFKAKQPIFSPIRRLIHPGFQVRIHVVSGLRLSFRDPKTWTLSSCPPFFVRVLLLLLGVCMNAMNYVWQVDAFFIPISFLAFELMYSVRMAGKF